MGDDVAGVHSALGTGLDDIRWEVLLALPPGAQAAKAVCMGAVGQDAEDPLSLWLVPHLVHANATHHVPTVLLPLLHLKAQAVKWSHKFLDSI